jgi:histidinol-phosphate aminotransferase
MSRLWNPLVTSLSPYIPGEQPALTGLVKLNTNENPYPPSPRVVAAIQVAMAADGEALRRYPDPESVTLKSAIAQHYAGFGIGPAQVFAGNGSDEVLAFVFLALLKQAHPLLFPDVTYSFYPVYCRLYSVDYQTVPLTADFQLDWMAHAHLLSKAGAVIFPNPNAPTGCALPLDALARLAEVYPDIPIVIDEAYVDFGAATAVALVHDYPNLLVVQTFSKSRSLAGLRVGFAIGDASLIEALNRVKNSFNSYPLDRLAQAGALAALEDTSWFTETRQRIISSRGKLSQSLTALGFVVLPSQANFLFARHPDHAASALAAALRERRVLVRHFDLPRIRDFLRITIGTEAECETLLAALRDALAAP